MNQVNTKAVILPLMLSILFLSCSSVDQPDNFVTLRVEKKDFVNKVTVSGVIEASKTYTIACPAIWTDATVTYLIPEGTYVNKGDTVCVLEASELENSYKGAVKNLETAKAEYNKSTANLNLQYLLLESQVRTIESSTAISQLDSSRLTFASPVQQKLIQLEIEKAEIEKNKIQKKLEFLKVINKSELRKMEMRIKQAENRVAREKEKLDKLILKSDITGMVIYSRLWTSGYKVKEGDIVWDNMPLIQIPDMSEMQVKLMVNETHFKQIEKDQNVRTTVDAYPDIKLKGKITKKTPMGKPIKRGSEVKVFEVFASVDSSDFKIQPGLSVSCDVILESVQDTVIVPLFAVFEDDSLKVVYIKDGEKYRKQTVELACNSDNYAVVSEGLVGNEEITLAEPPEELILY